MGTFETAKVYFNNPKSKLSKVFTGEKILEAILASASDGCVSSTDGGSIIPLGTGDNVQAQRFSNRVHVSVRDKPTDIFPWMKCDIELSRRYNHLKVQIDPEDVDKLEYFMDRVYKSLGI